MFYHLSIIYYYDVLMGFHGHDYLFIEIDILIECMLSDSAHTFKGKDSLICIYQNNGFQNDREIISLTSCI